MTAPGSAAAAAGDAAEQAFTFPSAGQTLVGLLHRPARPGPVGVVVVVGGPQYRAGSHRQFVHLARALAAQGHTTLRFDSRGMGDSSGALASFEQVGPDIGAAIDALLQRAPEVRRVVLWGLCDAASAALMYLDATPDPRVAGLCLLNPYVRSTQTLARTHVRHYYLQRLRDRSFWAKLLRGGIGLGAARGLAADVGRGLARDQDDDGSFRSAMRRGWSAFGGAILLVLSGEDLTAREFADALHDDPQWRRVAALRPPTRLDIPGADHTFSEPRLQAQLEAQTVSWLNGLASAPT